MVGPRGSPRSRASNTFSSALHSRLLLLMAIENMIACMAQQGENDLIKLAGVSKAFREPLTNPFKRRSFNQALTNVGLSIPRHRVSCLLGPNGAGKTTLLKILASLITPDSGTIFFDGVPQERWDKSIQGKIGLVTPNERSFYWRLTGRQNLLFFGSLHSLEGNALRERVEEALAETGMLDSADKPYRHYSSGMKQKLNIARALIGRPELYLLDEPATHLDPLAREEFWNFVLGTLIGKRGSTVFLCTHDLEEARRLADFLVILDRGRVVDSGTVPELGGALSGGGELEIRYSGVIPSRWLAVYGDLIKSYKPGFLRLALDEEGMARGEAIATFVQEGGILLEAFRSRVDLLELLNKRIKRDA
jgi:ABC-2 type transport system ATP-binding protein